MNQPTVPQVPLPTGFTPDKVMSVLREMVTYARDIETHLRRLESEVLPEQIEGHGGHPIDGGPGPLSEEVLDQLHEEHVAPLSDRLWDSAHMEEWNAFLEAAQELGALLLDWREAGVIAAAVTGYLESLQNEALCVVNEAYYAKTPISQRWNAEKERQERQVWAEKRREIESRLGVER